MGTEHNHRICTFKEAEEAIRAHETIYVTDCFCRTPAKEGKTPWEYCGHRIDVCMGFHKPGEEESYTSREISQKEAIERFEDWKNQGNFFRFMEDDQWICYCCGCGCDWFRDEEGNKKQDSCEKSPFSEHTDLEKCNACGVCVDICAFDARSIRDDFIVVDASNCYGCSACEYVCPENAVSMGLRI
jgi:ferredoxin